MVLRSVAVLLGISLVCFVPTGSVRAQEYCTAVDAQVALDQYGCIPDGFYLSAQEIADGIASDCSDLPSEARCRACFKKRGADVVKGFKALVKANLIERADLVVLQTTLTLVQNEACLFIVDESASQDSSPDPSENNQRQRAPGSDESRQRPARQGNGENQGGGEQCPQNGAAGEGARGPRGGER